jgi:hypothetical protein
VIRANDTAVTNPALTERAPAMNACVAQNAGDISGVSESDKFEAQNLNPQRFIVMDFLGFCDRVPKIYIHTKLSLNRLKCGI